MFTFTAETFTFTKINKDNNNNTVYFLSIFIPLTCRKTTEAPYIGQTITLNPEMPKYCCPLEIFYFGFLVL